MISRPVASSRLPVGSSATRIAGCGRQRAGERDALLLAAGQLAPDSDRRRSRQPDRRPAPARRARTRPRRRRVRAAPRRSPAPSWSGSGGTTGTRCRHGGRENAPAHPRRAGEILAGDHGPRRCRAAPARPPPSAGSTCPSPTDRPGRPPRRSYMQVDVLEDMNPRRAPAERQIDAGQRDRRGTRQSRCRSCGLSLRHGSARMSDRSYGKPGRPVQTRRLRRSGAGVFRRIVAGRQPRPAAGRPVRIVVLGDSLTRRLRACRRRTRLPAKLEARAQGQGPRGRDRECRRFRRYRGGRACAARLVGAEGTDAVILELGANDALRGADPKATRAALEAIIRRLKERAHRGAARRHAGAAQFRTGLCAGVRRDLSRSSRPTHDLILYPFFLDGVAGDRALNQRDGLHPTAAGVDVIVKASCRRRRNWSPRVRAGTAAAEPTCRD